MNNCKRIIIICGLFILSSSGISAQNGHLKNKEIAEAYLGKNNFFKANEYFLRAYNKLHTIEVAYHIGLTYMRMYEYDKAHKWFATVEKKGFSNFEFILNYAETLKCLKKYDEAKHKI